MRTLIVLLLCAPLVLATEVIDGANPPNPAKFDWDGGTKTATLLVDLMEGIRITGPGVTLEGAGHTIASGGLDNWGIRIDAGLANVTIRDCTVTGFPSGGIVFAADNDNCLVDQCTATGNRRATLVGIPGIVLGSGAGTVFRDNFCTDNDIGIRMNGAVECTVEDNTLTDNKERGIRMDAATGCVIRGNTATGNSPDVSFGSGISVFGDSGNIVEDNTANDNNGGIGVTGDDSVVRGNTANDNRFGGIQVTGDRNEILSNTTNRNEAGITARGDSLTVDGNVDVGSTPVTAGMQLFGVSNSLIRNNTVRDGTRIGFSLREPTSVGVVFENNTATGNANDGFRLEGADNIVRGNTADNNGGGGISCSRGTGYVVEENTAGGNAGSGVTIGGASTAARNTASANGGGISTFGDGNLVLDNTISGSTGSWGVRVSGGADNRVEGNRITGGAVDGIRIGFGSQRTVIVGNRSSGNSIGIRLEFDVADSSIYDNYFNNTTNTAIHGSATNTAWNVAATAGPNVVGGPSIGGNFWGTPTGTGHSETCTDANGDGFCDSPFVIDAGNSDLLPLVLNTPASCNPSGAGVYELGASTTLGGTVADNEGDLVTFEWREGTTVLFSGSVQAPVGGAPVALPDFTTTFALGVHALELVVDDGHVLDPVSCPVVVQVEDTTDPKIAPVSGCSMLWPPNHQMVTCTIQANASDNDGLPPTLGVSVTSNEPDDGLGDGDTPDDIQNLLVDQATGTITVDLRAERGGVGSGRVYTITITATDSVGNTSMTSLTVVVPRGLGQGGN